MARTRRYQVGDSVNNYRIMARSDDSRIVWVKCQHEGCQHTHKVYLSSIIQGGARKFCDMHKASTLQRRRMERAQEKHLQASVAAVNQAAKATPDMSPVTGNVQDSLGFRNLLDVSAVRRARDLAGLKWNGYAHEGLCYGWYMVQERCRTELGSVRWDATCAVCGTGRKLYDAQLKRGEMNRCPRCMRPRGRYDLARSLYRRAVEMKYDMTDPAVLLQAAHRLAMGFEDDGCLKWTADAHVTFKKMLAWETKQLQEDQGELLPVIQEEPEINWFDRDVAVWPTAVLEEYLRDMIKNPQNYQWLGLRRITIMPEMTIESQRRKDAAAEADDEA